LKRYAYGNQPTIAQWNLARFAETLLPILDPNPERAVALANEAISAFTFRFQEHWLAGMRDKLGLSSNGEGDLELAHALLRAMHENAADFTLTFRRLCDAAADEKADANVWALFANPAAYDSWVARWRSRLVAERLEPDACAQAMRTVNPAFIPRNHRVEQAVDAAIEYGDFSPFAELLTVLSRPYEDQAVFADYANPPYADERVFRTFCGT
jgi:serine/tyrosine/threonine adenylyltransferase